jgi:undecaprenyl-diphosphatase
VADTELRPGQALALGLIHGPAELLPISSSGHTTAIPWLLGWDYSELDPELRKALEVALHAGTALALLMTFRREVVRSLRGLRPRRLLVVALASTPAGAAGYAFGRPIERQLGTPAAVAVGMLTGGLALGLADLQPQERREHEARASDGLWLGLAQAAALVPGVSRNGASLTAARLLRFTREDSQLLSRQIALPVIVGATAFKTFAFLAGEDQSGAGRALLLGAGASFASTLACTKLIDKPRGEPLWPYAVYRMGLAALMFRRLMRGSRAHLRGSARR